MARISIDFDNCLSLKHVQGIAKDLVSKGHHVFVLTSRNDSIKRIDYAHEWGTNETVFSIATSVGIKPWDICYTNQTNKAKYLSDSKINIHIDDDQSELVNIKHYTNVKGFDCTLKSMKENLYEYLEQIENF